jgi:hypothetical protein
MSTTNTQDSKDYTPPAVEEVAPVSEKGGAAPVATVQSKQTPAPAKVEVAPAKIAEPTLVPLPAVIGVNKILNAKGTVVTDIMIKRIDKHLEYLNGTVGFKDTEERDEEQVSFIETIGNSLKMDFDGYVVFTDYLLTKIRDNQKVFTDGLAFRFCAELKKGSYTEAVKNYQAYIEFLTKIAINWNVRYKLKKLVDTAYVIQPLNQKGKENVTQYFNKLASV